MKSCTDHVHGTMRAEPMHIHMSHMLHRLTCTVVYPSSHGTLSVMLSRAVVMSQCHNISSLLTLFTLFTQLPEHTTSVTMNHTAHHALSMLVNHACHLQQSYHPAALYCSDCRISTIKSFVSSHVPQPCPTRASTARKIMRRCRVARRRSSGL